MCLRRPIVVAIAAAAVGAPAPAGAATVHVDPGLHGAGHGIYAAGDGEANRVAIEFEGRGRNFTVSDPGATIVAGDGCESIDAHTAHCVAPPREYPGLPPAPEELRWIRKMTVTLGDMDDRFTSSAYVIDGVTVDGGPGDDVLRGRGSVDRLDGAGGRDRLFGGENDDTLIDGDRGSDHLDGGNSHDDFLSYEHRAAGVSVDLGRGRSGEGDALAGLEGVIGGAGDDRIRGTDGEDSIVSGAGDDTIAALGGHDSVAAGDGDDVVAGGDGHDTLDGGRGADRAACGRGRDTVSGTVGREFVGHLCESITVDAELTIPAQPARVSRGAVWLAARCPRADGSTPCRGTFTLRSRGLLGRAEFSLDGPEAVPLQLTRRGRRAIRRPRGVVAHVSFRAAAPNGWSGRAGWAIRLRR
jgi:hypothetical protein